MGFYVHLCVSVLILLLIKLHTTSADTIAEYLCENQPPNTKLPHPEKCEVYLVCRDNKAIEMKCKPGVLFNPKRSDCDPNFKDCPANSVVGRDDNDNDAEDDDYGGDDGGDDGDDDGGDDAGDDGDNEDGGDADEDAPNADDDEKEDVQQPNNEKVEPVGDGNKDNKPSGPALSPSDGTVCPKSDTDQVTFLMHKSDCSIYFLCYHGKPIPFECSMGMHWSNKQKKCVPKEVSECGSISPTFDSVCPQRGIKFMPHPNVCQYFIFCLNGAQTVQRCEAFYHWDINEGKCKLKTMATCYRNLRQALDAKFAY